MAQASGGDNMHAEIVKGTAWVMALRLVVRGMGFVSTIILARLLMPEDFGLVALAGLIAASIELLGAFNFDIWLVRHRDPQRDDYDTVWTMALLRDLAVALIVLLLAAPAAAWFGDERLENVLQLLALATVVGAFRNVGVVDFRREMLFDREFKLFALTKLCSFLVTVSLALVLRNYWALVAGIFAGAVCRLLLGYLLHPYRPRPSLRLAREVMVFSRWLLLLSFTGFLYRKIEGLVIGKAMGSEALGFYSMAGQISGLASTELLAPLRRVLMPAYSRLQEDMSLLRASFTETFSLIMLFGLPLTIGIALLADPLVRLMLGERWLPVAPLMQILAVYAVATAFLTNQGPMLMALGHNRLLSNLYGFGLLFKVPLLLWAAASQSLTVVAMVVAAVHVMLTLISIVFTLRTIELPVGSLLVGCWHAVAASVLMSAGVLWVLAALDAAPLYLQMLAGVGAGALVYTLAVLALWYLDRRHAGGENIVIEFVQAKLKRGARPVGP